MFNLDNKSTSPPSKPVTNVKPQTYSGKTPTDAEIKEALLDFENVPEDQWSTLPTGIRIRYYTDEGLFRWGGWIKDIVTYDGHTRINLQNSYTTVNPRTWSIGLEKTSKIYRQIGQKGTKQITPIDSDSVKQSMKTLQKNLITINNNLIMIEKRVASCERNIQRMANVIKKHHKP